MVRRARVPRVLDLALRPDGAVATLVRHRGDRELLVVAGVRNRGVWMSDGIEDRLVPPVRLVTGGTVVRRLGDFRFLDTAPGVDPDSLVLDETVARWTADGQPRAAELR